MCLHRMDGKRFSLYHEPHDDPREKTQKKPHGSCEVIRCGSEHDVNRVSEKALVKIPSQTMIAFAVPDNGLYSCSLPKQFFLLCSRII